ncbi:TIGR00270 family protein [Candidatus Micrarchaeota archaeon]|nr:TIGR00270 family protein [Candidatus Micrarchaeota archaeon]
MNCEICGNSINKIITVVIDGTQFDVCSNCSSLGKKLDEQSVEDEEVFPRDRFAKERFEFTPRKKVFFEKQKSIQKIQNFSGAMQASSLIEGFGKKIMQARQKKGLTLKELAMKIYEKESVIQRIESEKFNPSDKTIRKLEKELEIKLTE